MKGTYKPLQGKSSMVVKLAMLALLSAACSNNSDNSAANSSAPAGATAPTYTVTVSVTRGSTAMTGNLILRNNGGDPLTITLPTGVSTGPFTGTFSTRLENAATYNVTVNTHPSNADCGVDTVGLTPGTGTINNANVTVGVICTPAPIF